MAAQDALPLEKMKYRPAVNAGKYYPADSAKLYDAIIAEADTSRELVFTEGLLGIIAPSVEFEHSYPTAIKTYRNLYGKNYDAIIVISPSHYESFDASSVYNGIGYYTPLGLVENDLNFAQEIAEFHESVILSELGHTVREDFGEYAIEMQLPYLQVLSPGTPVIPIVMGNQDAASIDGLMRAIVYATLKSKKKVLIIACAQLSHNVPYKEARDIDISAIRVFGDYNYFKLESNFYEGLWVTDAVGPIITTMMAAEQLGADLALPADYRFTGSLTKKAVMTDTVTTFFAAAMVDKGNYYPFFIPQFSTADLNDIFYSARFAMRTEIKGDSSNPISMMTRNVSFETPVFVKVLKDGETFGMTGSLINRQNLILEIEKITLMAAFQSQDNEFYNAEILDSLEYEITAISRLQRMLDLEGIVPTEDGIYLVSGDKRAVLLPEVALDNKLDREQYLMLAGFKAGLGNEAYLNPDNRLYRFKVKKLNSSEHENTGE